MNRTKFLSAENAALLVKSGDTIAVSGNGAGMTAAEAILAALEARFLATGEPRDLTLVHSLGLGDRDQRGTNRLAHEGMLRKIVASHFTWSGRIQQLIREEKIEASLRRIEEHLGILPASAPTEHGEEWKLPDTPLEVQDTA